MSSIMRKQVDKVNGQGAAPADEVMDLVHTLMHQFRSLQYQVLRGGPHDITHMESKVLGFFARHDGATQSDLVQHSGRDKAQVARLIKGLRDRGLLEAVPDEADRRNLRLHLTPEGQAVQRALHQQARRLGAQAVKGLDDAERRNLVDLLRRVRRNLEPD
jgi:DNA-binding MarR family transcriptional regulator